MNILYIVLAGAVGFMLGRASAQGNTTLPSTPEELAEVQEASRKALSKRTEKRKEDILAMMRDGAERYEELKACDLAAERKGIKRKDVEALLGVSKKTALTYLDALEDEGRIQQIGVAGSDVFYMLSSE